LRSPSSLPSPSLRSITRRRRQRHGDSDGQGNEGTVQASVSVSGNLSTVQTANENFVSGGTLKTLTGSGSDRK